VPTSSATSPTSIDPTGGDGNRVVVVPSSTSPSPSTSTEASTEPSSEPSSQTSSEPSTNRSEPSSEPSTNRAEPSSEPSTSTSAARSPAHPSCARIGPAGGRPLLRTTKEST